MSRQEDRGNNQSLHYSVKAFLLSAPLEVEVVRGLNSELEQVSLSISSRFPPPLGPKKEYRLRWTYREDHIELEEAWTGRALAATKIARSGDKLDLVELFWGREPKPLNSGGTILWRNEKAICRDLKITDSEFSFFIERHDQPAILVQGGWDSDGLLKHLKLPLSLPLPFKLGAITLERTKASTGR